MRLKKLLFISYNKIGVAHKLSFPPKLFGLPFFIPHFFGVYGQHQQNQKRKTSASSKNPVDLAGFEPAASTLRT